MIRRSVGLLNGLTYSYSYYFCPPLESPGWDSDRLNCRCVFPGGLACLHCWQILYHVAMSLLRPLHMTLVAICCLVACVPVCASLWKAARKSKKRPAVLAEKSARRVARASSRPPLASLGQHSLLEVPPLKNSARPMRLTGLIFALPPRRTRTVPRGGDSLSLHMEDPGGQDRVSAIRLPVLAMC